MSERIESQAESQNAVPSTGWPQLDLELALAAPDAADLAKSLLEATDRLEIPREGELPPMQLPKGDAVDRQLSRAWMIRFRGMPAATQARLPTLNDLLARVEFSVGEFQNAQRDFMALAKLGEDQPQQALARYHAFRSALERPHLSDASVELRHAIALDPARFSPVPLERLDPEQIQAADSTGMTLRCRARSGLGQGDLVTVRTLHSGYLSRSIAEILEDQRRLSSVKHRSLLSVLGSGHAGDGMERPFFTSAFHDGSSLDHYVQRSGVIAPKDFVGLLLSWVEALHSAHQAGVLHRGLRPDYVLIRRKVSGYSGVLTNFGLGLKPEFYQTPIDNPAHLAWTIMGRTLANALDYAAPEQVGRRPEPVSAATDVYALAKTACMALFGTPHPSLNHWRQAGEALAQILHECTREDPAQRPTLPQIRERLLALVDPEQASQKPGTVDPQMAMLLASYQPPPGVGMVTAPILPAGMPVRRRLSAREVLWSWRFQMLKWTSIAVLLLMVAAVVIAVFWPSGRPAKANETVVAAGVLLLKDTPVADAKLIFLPETAGGQRATAETDSQGRFSVQTLLPGDGAFPGRYKVVVEKDPKFDRPRIMPNLREDDRLFRELMTSPLYMETDVPRSYCDARTTKLVISIPAEGSNDLRLIMNFLGQ